jgi:membrane protease YdiL (CAAX protease family)
MINTPAKQLQPTASKIHPGLQFLIFIGVFLGALFICNIIAAGLVIGLYGLKALTAIANLDPSAPHFINALWILQLVGTTLPIFAAPAFFARVIVNDSPDYLKVNFRFHWMLLVLVFLIMFISNPSIELLSNINQKMKLPHFLKGLEDWMKDSENSAQKITDVMLQMKTVWAMLMDVLLIGLVTAIVEEFMFRGALQTIFARWTKNVHAAVWITAILFSAFHMEFYGFLPRLLLGVMFGYFVAWSGSIWPAVWAHFLNNGTDVVVTYLFQHKVIKDNPDDQHIFNYIGYAIGIALLLLFMYIYRKIAFRTKQIPVYDGEELD